MEKQKITVRVAGKEYALVSSDTPEHLSRVASYVDRQITETVFATRLSRETVTVLVALNITDELMKAQEENSRLRRELNALRSASEAPAKAE
ncbi:MAG: cell division protein ZapA [Aristaeellaceae bacterium]